MTPDPDPGIWKQVSGYLWALLLIPIGVVWRKIDGSVQREQMSEHIREDKEAHLEFRDTMRILFRNAEDDRRKAEERFAKMQEHIHAIHIDVIDRLKEPK